MSANAVQSGYLSVVADELESELMNLPGDRRTKIGFLCFDSALHFFKFDEDDEEEESYSQPQMLSVSDIDDPFEPMPDSLLVNREQCQNQIRHFLKILPSLFNSSYSTDSCAGKDEICLLNHKL